MHYFGGGKTDSDLDSDPDSDPDAQYGEIFQNEAN
jgi:hypothetical protein